MKTKSSPPKGFPIVGFEKIPQGKMLSQFVDFSHPTGAAYERCIAYFKDFHTHDRINLTFPRAASIIEFKTKMPDAKFKVDEASFLWMPANVQHSQDTLSTVYDNLAIFPTAAALKPVLAAFTKRHGIAPILPRETTKKLRSTLLNELLNEYFIERVLERKNPNFLHDLSRQILEEALRLLLCPKRPPEQSAVDVRAQVHGDPITSKAVRFLEAHLFDAASSAAVAEYAGTSPASLFRKFKAELGMTPGEYVISRRLDESLALLQSRSYTASDVATIVGYSELASFSKAFKAKFGAAPTQYIPKK